MTTHCSATRLRQAVASVVKSAVISEAGSFDDLTALLEQDSDVDLILLDLTMPGISASPADLPARAISGDPRGDRVGQRRRRHDPTIARFRRLPVSFQNASGSRRCATRS